MAASCRYPPFPSLLKNGMAGHAGLAAYCAVQPPSIDRFAPVTCAAASLHR